MKKILILSFFLSISFYFQTKAYADEKFDISTDSTYTVLKNGETQVAQHIKITNKTQFYYTPTYTISLSIKDIKNIKVYNGNEDIPYSITKDEDLTSVEINFKKRIVGLDNINSFYFKFDTDSISKKIGNIWEVNIPGISKPEEFTDYNISLITPNSFGNPSFIKPNKKLNEKNSIYKFTKEEIGESGAYITFGDKQFYKFNISYHISNPNLFPIKTEIALPPTTNYQDITINNISHSPKNVYQDEDGNWLATYSLSPQEKKDIEVTGTIKTNAHPQKQEITLKQRVQYTKQDKYWEVQDPQIQKLAKELKTPKKIYEYVVGKLNYNYEKAIGENERLGAIKSLQNTNDAVCLEFTDLFVAIARAAGIPTRAIEGYAYTQNSKLRPLSLIKDVLHAWPEYYDDVKQTWIMIDPTWGNTTGNMDYFEDLDLEHIVFVIKGKDSSYPVPAGGYKTNPDSKDIEISFAREQDFSIKEIYEVKNDLQNFYLSGFPIEGNIKVTNTGNSILKDKKIDIYSKLEPKIQSLLTGDIPPYGTKNYKLSYKNTPFLTNQEYTVKIIYAQNVLDKSFKVGIVPNNLRIYIGGAIFVTITAALAFALKSRRLFIQKQ
ncbi:transglutaminase family protein [Candidatus Parcubacteria bacterium]|nr:MAG: transglutaminase family protein [Candidatus Parcubacteria bacterium]